jgi:hypothetical protein
MAGFASGGKSWGGSVVVRAGQGGWVWALRMARPVPGSLPAPACLFIPAPSFAAAQAMAQAVVQRLGWPSGVRRGKRCASSWEVRVVLPSGLSAGKARAMLAELAGVR